MLVVGVRVLEARVVWWSNKVNRMDCYVVRCMYGYAAAAGGSGSMSVGPAMFWNRISLLIVLETPWEKALICS